MRKELQKLIETTTTVGFFEGLEASEEYAVNYYSQLVEMQIITKLQYSELMRDLSHRNIRLTEEYKKNK
jgi:hypothetical protein